MTSHRETDYIQARRHTHTLYKNHNKTMDEVFFFYDIINVVYKIKSNEIA